MSAIVTVSGYVAVDPKMGDAGGKAVANFDIPVKHQSKGEEKTTWFRCAVFGKGAETVAKVVRKGTYLVVTGRLTTREFESKGEKRTSLEVDVMNFTLGPKTEKDKPAETDEIPF